MDEDVLNIQIRSFLKKVGINCQRELEKALRDAVENGRLSGAEVLDVSVTLKLDALGVSLPIEGKIALE